MVDNFLKKSLKFVEDNGDILEAIGVGPTANTPSVTAEIPVNTIISWKMKYLFYIILTALVGWGLLMIIIDNFVDEKSKVSKRLKFVNDTIFGSSGVIPTTLLILITIVAVSFINNSLAVSINKVANSISKALDKI